MYINLVVCPLRNRSDVQESESIRAHLVQRVAELEVILCGSEPCKVLCSLSTAHSMSSGSIALLSPFGRWGGLGSWRLASSAESKACEACCQKAFTVSCWDRGCGICLYRRCLLLHQTAAETSTGSQRYWDAMHSRGDRAKQPQTIYVILVKETFGGPAQFQA